MVGTPLFADLADNIAGMKAKGKAVRLDFETMSTSDLLNALKKSLINLREYIYQFSAYIYIYMFFVVVCLFVCFY